MVAAIVWWLVIGLVVGGGGRLLVPGRNRLGILLTIGIGIVGALIGGFVTTALIGVGHMIITLIVSLVIAALLVSLVSRRRVRR